MMSAALNAAQTTKMIFSEEQMTNIKRIHSLLNTMQSLAPFFASDGVN